MALLRMFVLRSFIKNDTIIGEFAVAQENYDNLLLSICIENKAKACPIGTYNVVLYKSPKFGYNVLLLQNVPNRSFIEVHKANKGNQLEGCIAPNLWYDPTKNVGVNSTTPFDAIMSIATKHLSKKGNKIELIIRNCYKDENSRG
jgi:hypothetical protein